MPASSPDLGAAPAGRRGAGRVRAQARTARRVRPVAAAALLAVLAVGAPPHAAGAAAHGDSQVERGAAVYDFSCAVCHGATGRGFEEAVAAFPDDYRSCTRCHQRQNAPQMPGSQVGLSQMAFSLGDPPPLAEVERLARFRTAGALYRYVRAAMPRWAPGTLGDEAYLDVTAHLLRMVALLGADETLESDQIDMRRLE